MNPHIEVSELIASQAASGRFQLSDELRMKIEQTLAPDTSHDIQKELERLGRDTCCEAVDTLTVVKYIETYLTDLKDLLELIVEKALKSVSESTATCNSPPST